MAQSNRSFWLARDAARLGIPLEYLDASDGQYDDAFLSRILPLSLPNSTCADIIGAIFDSHERAWAVAAADDFPTLVLEDDVRLPSDFNEALGARMRALPHGFHVAFAGVSVTPNATRVSPLLSRPDADDANEQALLGFWAYVVSPNGARRLLRFAQEARHGGKRLFQPVDLFVAHRLKRLKAFVFEPTDALAALWANTQDAQLLKSMRQKGIVTMEPSVPSLNTHAADEEDVMVKDALTKAVEYGTKAKYKRSWRTSWEAARHMRRYSCWNAATLLQNAGLALLNLLESKAEGLPAFGGANETLLVALEAFASTSRYQEGTWMERRGHGDYPRWAQHSLRQRDAKGLPVVAPPTGWGVRVPLPCGGWLDASLPPKLFEPLEDGCRRAGDTAGEAA